ncbi:MAG TPA: hypothetical protein PLH98_01930 [Ruminococcus flavefaciens]|nr:hypothetical protein [Ruminococcus flavefaciens]
MDAVTAESANNNSLTAGFNIFTFLANWIKLVCLNLPFAFFSQLFFIQPLIRTCFKAIFRRKAETAQAVKT